MEPQTPIQAPSTTSSAPQALDPQAVNLAKAIRQSESGGNPTAQGKSGEYGAYQYTDGTWAVDSKAAGVNVPLEKSTLEQQNQVAYTKIKKLKDQGMNVGQIASVWNSGNPNAYLDPSYKGVNKHGASYDVPAYVKSVATAYQTLKNGGKVGADPNNPSSTANTTPTQTQPQGDSFLKKVQNVLTTIFPGTEQIGESLGTAASDIGQIFSGKNPFQNKTKIGGVQQPGNNPESQVNIPKTIGGYLSAGSMVAAPEVGGETALGRIGANAGLGAVAGGANALAQGGGVGDVAKGGLLGGAVGGALGGASELISKAANYLPYRLARTFLPGTSEETAQYAVQKGLGTPSTMLAASDSSLSEIGNHIDSILNDPSVAGIKVTPQEIYQSIIDKYPNAGLTMENVGEQLKKMAPLQTGLVDKLESGGLTPKELNQLKSAIGQNTYKMRFDEPAVKAGKDIGNAAYASISDFLKNVLPSIRSDAPDISPVFDEYTKELQLNGALQKAIRAGEKSRPFTLRDIVALMAGLGAGGPAGALGAYALERGATNPSVNLVAGGLLNKAANSGISGIARQGLVGLLGQGQK